MFFHKGDITNAIIGGAIMALASSLHLLVKGKITGISGSCFRVVKGDSFYYNLSFLLGMVFVSSTAKVFYSGSFVFENTSSYIIDLSFLGFVISGFLVGFGTKLANGCTSGHGVCGLPRLSKRSIVAVITFCAFGFVFATIRYHCPFLYRDFLSEYIPMMDYPIVFFVAFAGSIGGYIALLIILGSKKKWEEVRDITIAFAVGFLFGYGLLQSGMNCRHKVINFLAVCSHWDITLLFVLCSAVGINLITFNLILKYKSSPFFSSSYDLPSSTKVTVKLIIGAAIFGIGWGFAGICPGPAVLSSFAYLPHTLAFICMMSLGQFCAYWSEGWIDKHLGGNEGFKIFNDI